MSSLSQGDLAAAMALDLPAEAARIGEQIVALLTTQVKRRGIVLGLSGGIDSSCVAALCVRALGPERVVGLLMPERESSASTLGISRNLAETLGIKYHHVDISAQLAASGAYAARDAAIASVVPGYGDGWKSKIVLGHVGAQGGAASPGMNVYYVVAQPPSGEQIRKRLTRDAYLTIVAATNYKQRIRKMTEYFWADKLHFAVAGTPNRLEYDQGFFVKGGDGLADIKPIAHLYKTQVYAMAAATGVPADICARAPTTDTYSLEQGQDEFYFALPYQQMDQCLWAKNHGYKPGDIAGALGLSPEQVAHVYADIDQKRATTRPLHLAGLLCGDVRELEP